MAMLAAQPRRAAEGACRRARAWRRHGHGRVQGPLAAAARGFAQPTEMSMESLRARQPKALLRTDVFRTMPPEDISPHDLAELAASNVVVDPAKVLQVYIRHVKSGEEPDVAVLIRTFAQLGFLFDPNSFFSTADRQILTRHRHFRSLAHDLAVARGRLPAAAAPVLLYAMACLEYRCGPLLPALLDAAEANLHAWRPEVLSVLLHSAASLGLGAADGEAIEFELEDGSTSRDYSHVCGMLAGELGRRMAEAGDTVTASAEASMQDWARAAFAVVMAGLYEAPAGAGSEAGTLLPALVSQACAQVKGREDLDASGWAQFFLYQTLYCVDVEKPASEEAVKRAVPMWIQERLHHRWLDSIVLHAQPQGADKMQQDLDASLRRTKTQALLNCSAGRSWDEQHCWFAGFLLKPQIALECDSMLPLGPGRPRPSGWLALKSRVLQKVGFRVVTVHRCFWDRLTEDQKDDQVLRLRMEVGYVHDRALERQQRQVRQVPFSKTEVHASEMERRKQWAPMPSPPSE